jgi:hypothetical protein
MGSGTYSKDVPGRPYCLLFGELYRAGVDLSELGRICSLADNTVRRITFGEAPVIRRATAYKALRAVTLLPGERWLEVLGFEESGRTAYQTGSWLGEETA